MSFSFKPEDQYEQGGILLSLRPTSSSGTATTPPPKWIKAGIEFYNSVPRIGTVATENYSDWSLNPVSGTGEWTTLIIERGEDVMGYSLWVYQLNGIEKIPLREITWAYGIGEDWEVKVEAYAAKPGDEGKPLTVNFKDFNVNWE